MFNRRQRRNKLNFPVLILGSVAVIAISFFAFSYLFSSDEGELKMAHLNSTDNSRAQVKLSGSDEWSEVIDVYLNEGNVVRSNGNDTIYIDIFEDRIILDKGTTIKLNRIRQFSDQSIQVEIEVESGRIWALVERKINPRSVFNINYPTQNISIKTSDAHISLDKKEFVMMKGNKSEFSIQKAGEENPSFTRMIGVGQMLDIENKTLAPVSDEFRASYWYEIYKNRSNEEEIPKIEIPKAEEPEPIQENPDVNFGITSPEDNFSSKTTELILTGSADENVFKVKIDGWELTKFKNGNTKWTYKISSVFDNAGKDQEIKTYKAEAFDKENKLISSDKIDITFNLSDKVIEEEVVADAKDIGTCEITVPQDEVYFTSDPEITLSGTPTANTAKVLVDDYALSAFQKGNKTWTYRIKDEYGNRGKAGEEHEYAIQCLDGEDKVIGEDSILVKFKQAKVVSGETAR